MLFLDGFITFLHQVFYLDFKFVEFIKTCMDCSCPLRVGAVYTGFPYDARVPLTNAGGSTSDIGRAIALCFERQMPFCDPESDLQSVFG